MDRPCYEKTLVGFNGEVELLEQAIEWIKQQDHIFIKEVIYRPGEQDCVHIIYEGFPDTDPMMMKYWEQERGETHPNREKT
ncbi:hypothetical protein LCGC14_0976600 [marine sediment metagenome]|uniref:Uncharacterized protein n=1 Tax=marine sediment metagenome TaxID=412755 RepID=A0A0F9NA12_9ZZZZ